MTSSYETNVKSLLDGIDDLFQMAKTLPSGKDSALAFENSFPIVRAIKRQACENLTELMQEIGDQLLQSQQASGIQVNSSLQAAHGTGCLFRTHPSPLDLELLIDINDRLLSVVEEHMDEEEKQRNGVSAESLDDSSDLQVKRSRPSVEHTGVEDTSLSWVLKEVASLTSSASAALPAAKARRRQSQFVLIVPSDETAKVRLSSKACISPKYREVMSQQFSVLEHYQRPFRPLLYSKPNAIIPLLAELQTDTIISDDLSYTYPHPYEAEVQAFQPSIQQLDQLPACKAENEEDVVSLDTCPRHLRGDWPINLISDEFEFVKMLEHLSEQSIIAVDLEHHAYHSFLGFTCLIQISTVYRDFIIDPLTMEMKTLQLLNKVFTDPNIIKVFHGAQSDLMWLQRDFGIYVVNLFDTYFACKQLHFPRASYQYLLNRYCGIDINKKFQTVDWRIRPLPRSYLLYACADTHYLIYIFACLHETLANSQERYQVYELSRQLCQKVYRKPQFEPNAYEYMCSGWAMNAANSVQRGVFKALTLWRWNTAYHRDQSLHFVLPDEMIKKIAEELPKEHTGLLACCNPPPALFKQHDCRQEVLNIINDIKTSATLSPTKINGESALITGGTNGDQSKVLLDADNDEFYIDYQTNIYLEKDAPLIHNPLWSTDNKHLCQMTLLMTGVSDDKWGFRNKLANFKQLCAWCRNAISAEKNT